MKYICLGYIEPNKFETMSESERNAMLDECFTYDEELRKNGHFAGGEALQGPYTATTLRWKNGKASVRDGPYAENKRTTGRNSRARSARPESRDPVDVETSGSQGRAFRDPSGGRFDRNDPRKRSKARQEIRVIKLGPIRVQGQCKPNIQACFGSTRNITRIPGAAYHVLNRGEPQKVTKLRRDPSAREFPFVALKPLPA